MAVAAQRHKDSRMRIAQIAPLFESVPPAAYGGTERVVSYLTEELVEMGHAVTLFASGDSLTNAELVPVVPRSLRLDPGRPDWVAWHTAMLDQVFDQAAQFDVMHFHIDVLHYPLARRCATPCLTTLHGRLDLPDLRPLHERFHTMPVVSISNSQREALPKANWCATVYHGLPLNLYRMVDRPGGYFAFVGRLSPEKRVDRAIEIALACNTPLRIAAKIDSVDRDYFRREIEPMLAHPLIEFVGEIGDADKGAFIGNARALLFPVDWPEPFGIVMIEAFACGTPVIGYDCGAVPEVLQDGITGFLVRDQEAAIQAARNIGRIDRRRCREVFERRFSVRRMAERYLQAYRALIDSHPVKHSGAVVPL